MTNNKNLGKRVKNQNHNVQYTGTQQIHLYLQAVIYKIFNKKTEKEQLMIKKKLY